MGKNKSVSTEKHATGIEWTHIPGTRGETWNPIVGCSIVSPGCTNCYAMKMAARLETMSATQFPQYRGTTKRVNGNAVWTGKVALAEGILTKPLAAKKPRTYFVNSMGDLFHEDVPYIWIDRVFAVMALCPQHTFIVLTKRSARMLAYCSSADTPLRVLDRMFDVSDWVAFQAKQDGHQRPWEARPQKVGFADDPDAHWPLSNVWLGVSTERQQEANERIPDLLNTPAAVRLISAEPLLGPIDLVSPTYHDTVGISHRGYLREMTEPDDYQYFSTKLDWVIAGGESGSGARPMHPDWVRSIRDQCAAADVPFFFKQWGEWEVASDENGRSNGYSGHRMPDTGEKYTWLGLDGRTANPSAHDVGEPAYAMAKVGKIRSGNHLDGRQHLEFPRNGKVPA